MNAATPEVASIDEYESRPEMRQGRLTRREDSKYPPVTDANSPSDCCCMRRRMQLVELIRYYTVDFVTV